MNSNFRFSFFRRPIQNLIPAAQWTLADAWKYITGLEATDATIQLRSLSGKDERRTFKAYSFDYAVFSGIFSKRGKSNLIEHSGLICLDFDHVIELEELFNRLLQDEYFETQLLFRSPSGDGLKWVIPIDADSPATHEMYFKSIFWYCHETYGITPDEHCRDVGRACFLPYDPDAYLSPNIQLL